MNQTCDINVTNQELELFYIAQFFNLQYTHMFTNASMNTQMSVKNYLQTHD